MSSRRSLVLRGFALVVAGLGAVAIQSPQAEAGAFFGRLFGRNNCQQCYQQQQVPVQAAPNSAAPAGSYQSNSFEPNASAPAAVAAPAAPRYSSPAPARGIDQFRGDRKALGKF